MLLLKSSQTKPLLLAPRHTLLPGPPPFSRPPAGPPPNDLTAVNYLLWTAGLSLLLSLLAQHDSYESPCTPSNSVAPLRIPFTPSAAPLLTPAAFCSPSALLSLSIAALRCDALPFLPTPTVLQHRRPAAAPPTMFADDQCQRTFLHPHHVPNPLLPSRRYSLHKNAI